MKRTVGTTLVLIVALALSGCAGMFSCDNPIYQLATTNTVIACKEQEKSLAATKKAELEAENAELQRLIDYNKANGK